MHLDSIFLLIYCYFGIVQSFEDIAYIDLSELESDHNRGRSNSITPKPIDIFTNYPDTETVVESYRSLSTAYPTNKPSSRRFTSRDNDFSYMQNQKYTDTKNPNRNSYDYSYRRTWPKFKTKNYTSTQLEEPNTYKYLSHVQKIPKPPQKQPAEVTQTTINNILKKYIAKLQSEKQQRPKKDATWDPANHRNVQSKFMFEESLMALKNKTMKFANKFFGLFTVIEFPNSRCVVNSASSEYEGTCYHRTECESLNGTSVGECADGYGVCCVCKYFLITVS